MVWVKAGSGATDVGSAARGGSMPSIMNTMKVVVFGASGRVGRRMVEYALDAGHEVTAFVRHPIDLKDHPHAGDFRVEVGSIRERETVTRAMTGQEAVL